MRKERIKIIRAFEEDVRIFNSQAKRKGLPQPEFFRIKMREEDDVIEKKRRRGFNLEL